EPRALWPPLAARNDGALRRDASGRGVRRRHAGKIPPARRGAWRKNAAFAAARKTTHRRKNQNPRPSLGARPPAQPLPQPRMPHRSPRLGARLSFSCFLIASVHAADLTNLQVTTLSPAEAGNLAPPPPVTEQPKSPAPYPLFGDVLV